AGFLSQNRANGFVLEKRVAEIEQQHVADVMEILQPYGIVQSPQRALALDHLDREIAVDEDRGGLPGQKLEQRADDGEDRPDFEQNQDEPANDRAGNGGHVMSSSRSKRFQASISRPPYL